MLKLTASKTNKEIELSFEEKAKTSADNTLDHFHRMLSVEEPQFDSVMVQSKEELATL